MKNKLFAAALAALTLATAGVASAQDYRRGDNDRHSEYRGDRSDRGDYRGDRGRRHRQQITIRNDGHTFTFDRDDRMFYRLTERPFYFRAGLTYSYTDRCNRRGCVVFVFDGRERRPVDRIFAPHLPDRRFVWREARSFDRDYDRFGRYDRDDRNWDNDSERGYREWRRENAPTRR